MNKLESIYFLKENGFNVPKVIQIKSKTPNGIKDELSQARRYIGNAPFISIRTEEKERFGSPFFYRKRWEEVEEIILSLDPSTKIFISESLDANDCLSCGRIAFLEGLFGDYIRLEILPGPFMVRDLDNNPNTLHKEFTWENLEKERSIFLRYIYSRRDFFQSHKPCVVEFSIYPYGVGEKYETAIFWEFYKIGSNKTSEQSSK